MLGRHRFVEVKPLQLINIPNFKLAAANRSWAGQGSMIGLSLGWESDVLRWLSHLVVFVLVLAVMKFFFGWNISIIGSVVLTIIFSVVFSLINRR